MINILPVALIFLESLYLNPFRLGRPGSCVCCNIESMTQSMTPAYQPTSLPSLPGIYVANPIFGYMLLAPYLSICCQPYILNKSMSDVVNVILASFTSRKSPGTYTTYLLFESVTRIQEHFQRLQFSACKYLSHKRALARNGALTHTPTHSSASASHFSPQPEINMAKCRITSFWALGLTGVPATFDASQRIVSQKNFKYSGCAPVYFADVRLKW